MKRKEHLTISRAAEIYAEMVSCRRQLYGDQEFFKATEFWEELFRVDDLWTKRTYRNPKEYKLKASVVAFELRVMMTVDEQLWEKAVRGGWMENFVLAHELGHIALRHHEKDAITKHFQVFRGSSGLANIPPTLEEEEANYAAVFLQCGVALEDPRWGPVELARRAFSDPLYVKKAQAAVKLEAFQNHLKRPKPKYMRVVL